MDTNNIEIKKTSGVQLAIKMLESQRQVAKELLEKYNDTNSSFRKRVEKFKKENTERATPPTNSL